MTKYILIKANDESEHTDYDLCRFALLQFSEENIKEIEKKKEIFEKYPDIYSLSIRDIGIVDFFKSDSLKEEDEISLDLLLKDNDYRNFSDKKAESLLSEKWTVLNNHHTLHINKDGFYTVSSVSNNMCPQWLRTYEFKFEAI